MIIKISDHYLPEKKYIIDTIIGHFLGLEYKIEIDNSSDEYKVEIENGNLIIISDSFFSKLYKNNDYLKNENIPNKIKSTNNPFVVEKNLPIIYGDDTLEKFEKESSTTIKCGVDIFASSFFMLTRWEEYAIETRDKFGRFSSHNSLAYINNFLNRPVVNEYAEMLWNMLEHLDYEKPRKKRNYTVTLTHDIDHLFRWRSMKILAKKLGKDLIHNKSLKEALVSGRSFLKSKVNWELDPFMTTSFLMDTSEEINVKSHFFFMSGSGKDNYGGYSSATLKKSNILTEIVERDHIIGFHPSYNTYNDEALWQSELSKLQAVVPEEISCGRQHALMFEIPYTWRLWEKANMQWESTMGYADTEGFRSGTCYEYKVFDVLDRKTLNIVEKPLLMMDTTFFTYQKIRKQEIYERVNKIKAQVQKYAGEFVILWHNSNLTGQKKQIYLDIVKSVRK
ncbi:polysaccharide deacetylase family protein [Patescibacteria group bacterium]